MASYQHRKKNPSSDNFMKITNFQDDAELTYEKYQLKDSDRNLSSWEKAELRVYCEENKIDMPDPANFQDFFRIVGRGPEYFCDVKKDWVKPANGEVI